MRIHTPDYGEMSFVFTDHGLACRDRKGEMVNVLCVCASKGRERRFAVLRVACANGETVEIVATAKTTTVYKFRSKKR